MEDTDGSAAESGKQLVPSLSGSERLVVQAPAQRMPTPVYTRGDMDFTQQLETLQRAYVAAVLAAAGCASSSSFPDKGTDVTAYHFRQSHIGGVATLDMQLKCTSTVPANPNNGFVSVTLKNERFRFYANTEPSYPRIIVAMIAPKNIDDWLTTSNDLLTLRHCCYWRSIRGKQTSGLEETSVRVPTNQPFDEKSICRILNNFGSRKVLP